MADWLLLRLPHADGEPACWLVADANGRPLGAVEQGPPAQAASAAAGRRVCALVPGADVLLAEPELPLKPGVKLQQLLPYALEEHLADDIDELHFAVGKRAPDSSRAPVAVVSRALMDEWLAILRGAGIEPECLYTDSELLPQNPGQAIALLEEDSVCVRTPGGAPVSLPADALEEALTIAQSAAAGASPQEIALHGMTAQPADAGEAPMTAPRGLILYTGAAEWHRHAATVEAARVHFESISVQLLSDGPLALFAQQLPVATPINLLQGAYAPRNTHAVGLRAWRVAAVLLAGLVALHILGKATELHYLKAKEHQVDSSIRDTLRAAMPDQQGTQDARHRMEQRLLAVRSGGSTGLLAALEALAYARNSAPGTSVQAVNFHDGVIDLKLAAPDAASLGHLSELLRNSGWQAEILGGNNVGNSYEGRVQIHASGT
jgi:general secretion pathway protein L